jgi:hypothetical protein
MARWHQPNNVPERFLSSNITFITPSALRAFLRTVQRDESARSSVRHQQMFVAHFDEGMPSVAHTPQRQVVLPGSATSGQVRQPQRRHQEKSNIRMRPAQVAECLPCWTQRAPARCRLIFSTDGSSRCNPSGPE